MEVYPRRELIPTESAREDLINIVEHVLEWMVIEDEIRDGLLTANHLSAALEKTFNKYAEPPLHMAPVIQKHLLRMIIICPRETRAPNAPSDDSRAIAGDIDDSPELWELAREDVAILISNMSGQKQNENHRD